MKINLNKEAFLELFICQAANSDSILQLTDVGGMSFPNIDFYYDFLDEEVCNERCNMMIYINEKGLCFITFKSLELSISSKEYKYLYSVFNKCLIKHNVEAQKEEQSNDLKILNKLLITQLKKEKRNILIEKQILNLTK